MKKEIRVIGIDDAPFNKFKKGKTLIIATVFRGGLFLDGILSTKVDIDGDNATEKLIQMINNSKFKPQLQCIFLDGIALGGFNIVDIEELYKKTKIPVIVVIRRKPNIEEIKETLMNIGKENKISILEKAGKVIKVNRIFIQIKGLSLLEAQELLKITCTRSYIPEPIRVAHLIASGIIFGESRGRA